MALRFSKNPKITQTIVETILYFKEETKMKKVLFVVKYGVLVTAWLASSYIMGTMFGADFEKTFS